MSEKRFSEKQAAEILNQAVQMQRRGSDDPDGVSLTELRRIGAELGIDENLVVEAANRAERDAALDAGQSALLGAPPQYEVARVLPGLPTPEGWVRVVAEMDRIYGKGEATAADGVWKWHHKGDLGWIDLSLTEEGGRTRQRLMCHIDGGIATGVTVAFMLSFLGAGLAFSKLPLWGAAITVSLVIGVVWLALYSTCRSWYRQDRRKSEDTLDRVADILRANAGGLDRLAKQPAQAPHSSEDRVRT